MGRMPCPTRLSGDREQVEDTGQPGHWRTSFPSRAHSPTAEPPCWKRAEGRCGPQRVKQTTRTRSHGFHRNRFHGNMLQAGILRPATRDRIRCKWQNSGLGEGFSCPKCLMLDHCPQSKNSEVQPPLSWPRAGTEASEPSAWLQGTLSSPLASSHTGAGAPDLTNKFIPILTGH